MNNTEKIQKQRSKPQNNSLHKYCTDVANLLKEHGITLTTFYQNIDVDPTMESVKALWRTIATAKYGKISTTELTTVELQEVFEEVNRHIAQWGIHVPWPSAEEQSFNQYFDK